eukprot:6466677-Amphidinium_carterae.2
MLGDAFAVLATAALAQNSASDVQSADFDFLSLQGLLFHCSLAARCSTSSFGAWVSGSALPAIACEAQSSQPTSTDDNAILLRAAQSISELQLGILLPLERAKVHDGQGKPTAFVDQCVSCDC